MSDDLTPPRRWTRNGDERTSPTGRFTLTPNTRPARRGGETVTDGWAVNDTLNGTTRVQPTMADVARQVKATLADEAAITEGTWTYTAPTLDRPIGPMGREVRFTSSTGQVRSIVLGCYGTTAPNYRSLLESLVARTGNTR